MEGKTMRQMTAVLVVLAGLASLCFAQRPLGKGANVYSREKEIALGRTLASELEKQHAPIRDPEINAYLGRVGQALASQPPAAPYQYTFTLVRGGDTDPWLDPVALPGGWIFIDARSLATFENEAQFAGILAHAIMHVTLRHQLTRAQPRLVIPGREHEQVALSLLLFARGFEREADDEGTVLMAQAGYNPAELIRYLEKLPPEPATPRAYATHPTREDRIKAIHGVIDRMPERTYTPGTGDFDRIKALVAQLPPA